MHQNCRIWLWFKFFFFPFSQKQKAKKKNYKIKMLLPKIYPLTYCFLRAWSCSIRLFHQWNLTPKAHEWFQDVGETDYQSKSKIHIDALWPIRFQNINVGWIQDEDATLLRSFRNTFKKFVVRFKIDEVIFFPEIKYLHTCIFIKR